MGLPLSELGLSTSDTVQVEHTLVLSLAPSWREPVQQAIRIWGNTSRSILGTLRIVGYGVATFLVLYGVSKVIDSINKGSSRKRLDSTDNDDE